MRIVAGKYRGFSLHYPKTELVRPTQDRVKEGLFSALSTFVDEADVLDLFCGCGSLGLESVSRGAKSVCFVDIDTRALLKNTTRFDEPFLIFRQDVLKFISRCDQRFDLIFLDPPWTKLPFFERSLKAISEFDILKPLGRIICEHPKDFSIQDIGLYQEIKMYRYGNTSITILGNYESNLSG